MITYRVSTVNKRMDGQVIENSAWSSSPRKAKDKKTALRLETERLAPLVGWDIEDITYIDYEKGKVWWISQGEHLVTEISIDIVE